MMGSKQLYETIIDVFVETDWLCTLACWLGFDVMGCDCEEGA